MVRRLVGFSVLAVFGVVALKVVLSVLGAAFSLLVTLFWIAAMTRFDLSYAYPFVSLSFVLVFLLSIWLFQEPATVYKVVGLLLIVSGILVTSRSM